MKNLLIFTRRSSLVNMFSKAKQNLQENIQRNFLNGICNNKNNTLIDKVQENNSINSSFSSLKKKNLAFKNTSNQTIGVIKSKFTFNKISSATFSTNISLDEIEQKKKADNNKKPDKKIKEEEKLGEEEKIKNIKNIKTEINPEIKIAKTIQKIDISRDEVSDEKEVKSEKLNKMIYLKKLSPDLKVVIAKKVKKIYPNKNQKSLYPLMQLNELPKENELHPNDPFLNLLDEKSRDELSLTNIQNENRRIVFNKSLEKATKTLKTSEMDIDEEFHSNNFRNEEFSEYKKTIENIYFLTRQFSIKKFREVINYVLENPIEDYSILRKLEEVFVEKIREIDCNTKSELVLMLAKNLHKKKMKFNENSWFQIFKDFQSLLEMNVLSFKDYYNYTIAFEKIKNIIFAARPRYMNEFERFIHHDNLTMINSGRVKLAHLEDLILLSSLIHAKIFSITSISDSVWISLNDFIVKNSLKLNINSLLVLTTLLINYSEVSTKAPVLLGDAINEIAKFINLVFTNFEFLDDHEKMNIINFSDSLFNFYLIFIHSNTHNHKADMYKNTDEFAGNKFDFNLSNDGFLIKNLISLYFQKIKLQNNFNFFHELRILIFLSKEIKYFDQEFWSECAKSLKSFLKIDFLTKISDILPKRIGSGTSSAKARANAIEIEEMSKLFYYGVIIEVFSTVNYYEGDFWNCIFDKFDEIVPMSKKDPLILLQFISLHCKKLYKNRKFDKMYERLVNKFSPEFKRIFINREILDFLIGVNFLHKDFNSEKNNKIILNLVNPLYHFRPLDVEKIDNRILLNNNTLKIIDNYDNNKIYEKNEENLVEKVNFNDNINSLQKDVKTEENIISFDNQNQNKEALVKDGFGYMIEEQSENSSQEEVLQITYEKEPNNILLLITYLNLIWSKSIFEEKVILYILYITIYFFN